VITKKQIIWITFYPILLFSLLDLTTTYYGVCIHGGIELNVAGMRMMQKYGFLIGSLIYISKNILISGMFSVFLWKAKDTDLSKVFLIVVIVLFITELANVVVLNVNVLIYQLGGKGFAPRDESTKDITPQQAQEIKETFVREDFCRWI